MSDVGDPGLPGPQGAGAAPAPQDAAPDLLRGLDLLPGPDLLSGLSLLQCPRCGGGLGLDVDGGIACGHCRAPVQAPDGIIDFVAGAAATDLDNIDYDTFYPISQSNALHLYGIIKEAAGPLWPAHLGDAVEIGAGTGGFTMAVLREAGASRVVVTDISTKMLGLCRARLAGIDDLRVDGLTFATYGATEACFRAEAFDTCFGTAVIHHIIDVPLFLTQVHRLLKAGGRAFFMEPNLRFHVALTATLATILAEGLRNGTLPRDDVGRMVNWLAEVHCNIVNSGDLEVLIEREDKHLFVGETFEALARSAGFGVASALPGGLDPTGFETIRAYLEQSGVSQDTLDRLRLAWPLAQRQHFPMLAPRDRSPSYLFWLEKKTAKGPPRRAAPEPPVHAATPGARRPLLSLTFTLRHRGQTLELAVDGWCVATERIKSVQITACGSRSKLPIWRPRLDVHARFNRDGAYPPLHALCSGVQGKIALADAPRENIPIRVIFDIVLVDDRRMRGQSFMLVPGGDGQTIQLDSLGEPLGEQELAGGAV